MSQKYIKSQNKNRDSAAFGKYFATAVYDNKFVETDDLATFIQQQATVKKSDIGAVLDVSSRWASPASVSPTSTTATPRPSPAAVSCSSPRVSVSSLVRRRRTARSSRSTSSSSTSSRTSSSKRPTTMR